MNLRDGAKDSKTEKPRGMRKETARCIEAAIGQNHDWLDMDHSMATDEHAPPMADGLKLSVTISQYNMGSRMGAAGGGLKNQPGVIQGRRVSREWLDKNMRGFTTTTSLCLVTGFGGSMRPMFNPGDPLIVDASVNTVEFDTVYFFRAGKQGFHQAPPTGAWQGAAGDIGECGAYRDWVIDPSMDFEVFGRVLKVWRGEAF